MGKISGKMAALGLSALLLVGVAAAACGTSDEPGAPDAPDTGVPTATVSQPEATGVTEAEEPTPTVSEPEDNAGDEAEPVAVTVSGSGVIGGDPRFNYGTLIWQGYWLSRAHFGPFVMASGMGIPFEPPMEMLMGGMAMVAQNADDPVMIPQNMFPLQAVFRSRSPDLINNPLDYGPVDFEAFRLDEATFDKTVGVRGQAETMLKESQWARNFANAHFGKPTDDFGAQQRFMGVMVAMLAQMQGRYAMENLMGEDGLFRDSDGALDYIGNWVLLHAFADIAGITAEDGPHANPGVNPMFDAAAVRLAGALADREPKTAREAAAAIRALVFVAYASSDAEAGASALARLSEIAGTIATDGSPEETAAAIAGLLSASAAAAPGGASDLSARATGLFDELEADFQADRGVFGSKSVYGVDDVAWIIGGLNSLALVGDAAIRTRATDMLVAFYDATIGIGGLQLSAPPGKNGAMAGEWEKNLPNELFYHPANTPPPPMVGKLMVPAAEIAWDGAEWSVTDDRFLSGSAMHLANELNWLGPHLGSLLFPPLN